jgi:hypothetical protein
MEEGKWEGVAQTMYTYVSKCKNDKIKERKKKNIPECLKNSLQIVLTNESFFRLDLRIEEGRRHVY